MKVRGDRQRQRLVQAHLHRRGIEQICSSNHLSDPIPSVVYHHRERVGSLPVGAHQDRIIPRLKLQPAPRAVVHPNVSLRSSKAPASYVRARAILQKPAATAPGQTGRTRAATSVGVQALYRVAALALRRNLLIPIDAEPAQISALGLSDVLTRPPAVQIFDAQQQASAVFLTTGGISNRQPRCAKRERVSKVQMPRRCGRESASAHAPRGYSGAAVASPVKAEL